mgnify:CR=1 FL=1
MTRKSYAQALLTACVSLLFASALASYFGLTYYAPGDIGACLLAASFAAGGAGLSLRGQGDAL